MLYFCQIILIILRNYRNYYTKQENQNSKSTTFLLTTSFLVPPRMLTREWYLYPQSMQWAKFLFSSTYFLEYQFISNFQMSCQSLHNVLQPYIQKQKTHLLKMISSECRLAIYLYHITLSVPYLAVLNQFGCGRSTVSLIVKDMSRTIVLYLSTKYIRFSTIDQAMRTMEFW